MRGVQSVPSLSQLPTQLCVEEAFLWARLCARAGDTEPSDELLLTQALTVSQEVTQLASGYSLLKGHLILARRALLAQPGWALKRTEAKERGGCRRSHDSAWLRGPSQPQVHPGDSPSGRELRANRAVSRGVGALPDSRLPQRGLLHHASLYRPILPDKAQVTRLPSR